MSAADEMPNKGRKDVVDRYFAAAKELHSIRGCSENIIVVQGRVTQENLIIPLASFIEWAISNWTGSLALIFPTLAEVWCALEGVEAYLSLRDSVITDIDKKNRRFRAGNKWFHVCSRRTKDNLPDDISGMFIYRVRGISKIYKMYKQIDKSSDYKIVSVHSDQWMYCVQSRNAVETKVARVITTPFIDPLNPRLFYSVSKDVREALEKQRVSEGCSGYLHMQGLYWDLVEWEPPIDSGRTEEDDDNEDKAIVVYVLGREGSKQEGTATTRPNL
ncbi:MAG: hypothetical protein OXG53_06040 [Chloroflexi bacterium]|nr:hypothetical protein [Chloroflexota bacterium]